MSAEKMVVCNSVREADCLFHDFIELMDKLGELDKASKVKHEVYLTNGDKYSFVGFIQRDKLRGSRAERVPSEFFEIIMRIYMEQGNA